jgi:protein TIF31
LGPLVPFNEADARGHVQRLKELLSGGQADPSSIGVDGGLSVQDAVRNIELWEEEQKPAVTVIANSKSGKKAQAETAKPEESDASTKDRIPEWKSSKMSQLIPTVMKKERSFPQCLRHLSVSAWNPPPHHLRIQGHFLYLHIITLEGEHLYITASNKGFYINKSSASRFDPAPRTSPDDYPSCSLFDVLCGVSPLFLANFSKLFKDPISQRDYFAVVPISNCLPSHPWLARKHDHTADVLRSQCAYLLTGATSIDTLDGTRDWNDEIQSTRELPRSTLPERLMRDRVLNRVYAEFTLAAARAVPRVAAGEVQAMNPMDKSEAQMFIVNNLFISKGVDGVDIYPHMGGDEAAHVAVSKDVQGIKCLNNLDVEGICLLGTVVIDWMGERWVAQSVVPGLFRMRDDEEVVEEQVEEEKAKKDDSDEMKVDESEEKVEKSPAQVAKSESKEDTQVIYGGVDGPEIIKKDASFHTLFGRVARNLHLALHDVQDAKGEKHSLWLSVDSKGLRGADGRKYALDLARLSPVDVIWLEKHMKSQLMDAEEGTEVEEGTTYPHRMTLLRQEIIEIFWDNEFRSWAREELLKKKEQAGTEEVEKNEPERLDATQFQLNFNPDAFVDFKMQDGSSKVLVSDESEPSVAAVRRAGEFLQNVSLPRLVSDVAIGTQTTQDGLALTRQMHSRGINMRYLGVVAHHCHPTQRHRLNQDLLQKAGPGVDGFLNPFKKVVLQEMILRASKRFLRMLLKQVDASQSSQVVSHFLNCLLGDKVNSSPVPVYSASPFAGEDDAVPEWTHLTPESVRDTIRRLVGERFRYRLPANFLGENIRKNQLLREICLRCGIQLKLKDYIMESNTPSATVDAALPASNGGHASEDSQGEASAGTNGNTHKKKKKGGASSAIPKNSTSFEPDDILSFVPIIKESTPKSVLAEEAFESGRITMGRGDRALGLELMTEGIQFHEQVYGVVHPEVARCYSIFATILHHYATILAVEQAEKQREIQASGSKEVIPPSPLSEQINLVNALRYQRQAVTVSERCIGLDSDETLGYYINLAVLERLEGNTEASLRCQGRVLHLLDTIIGEDHPDVINALNNVAMTLQSSRQFDKSLKVYIESHDMATRLYGKDSINSAYLGHELSQAYTLVGDLKKAIDVEKQVNRVFEDRLGKEDNMTKESSLLLNNLAASAVRLAKMDARTKEATRIGLTNQIRGTVARPSAVSTSSPAVGSSSMSSNVTSAATASAAARGNMSNASLDDLVKFIQGPASNSTPSSSSKKKIKKLGRK